MNSDFNEIWNKRCESRELFLRELDALIERFKSGGLSREDILTELMFRSHSMIQNVADDVAIFSMINEKKNKELFSGDSNSAN